jgi:hypothetical protein
VGEGQWLGSPEDDGPGSRTEPDRIDLRSKNKEEREAAKPAHLLLFGCIPEAFLKVSIGHSTQPPPLPDPALARRSIL